MKSMHIFLYRNFPISSVLNSNGIIGVY